jgi:hypothetical protein
MFSFSSRARFSAWANRFGAMSTPVTIAPVHAAGIDWFPVPHPTSNTFIPGFTRSRRQTLPPHPDVRRKLAEVARRPHGFYSLLAFLQSRFASCHLAPLA